jgi:seryl-tRNA synthetase
LDPTNRYTRTAIASERQADGSAVSQLNLLQTSRASLSQRLTEAEEERDRLQAKLELKLNDRNTRKARLVNEVKRNRPELLRFNEKLGCRISAGAEKGGKAKSTMIKFTFNLINPDDWKYEAKFVIDASKANYQSKCSVACSFDVSSDPFL